jgi:hypothetical protein
MALTGLEGRAGLEVWWASSPKERPARNQDTFPTSSDTERAKTGAKRGGVLPQ